MNTAALFDFLQVTDEDVSLVLHGGAGYYVTGTHGGMGFGRLARTLGSAEEMCRRAHAAGYRYLRIHEYATRTERKFRIR